MAHDVDIRPRSAEPETEARLRPVSSRQNALVKELRHAFTRGEPTQEGYVAIEGVRILEEAVRSGLRFRAVFFSDLGRRHAARILPQIARQVETLLLPDPVFAGAVATESPQGVAALVQLKSFRLDQILPTGTAHGMDGSEDSPLVLGLAGVQDPGNVGVIIRSAEAFSARAVLLGEKTASHANAKAIRASTGSVFREPVLRVRMAEAVDAMKQQGLRVAATSSHKGRPLDEIDLQGPLALLIGNEGAGLPADILARADDLVTIPHSSGVESLNAGTAASILLYEAARQRRGKGRSPSLSEDD